VIQAEGSSDVSELSRVGKVAAMLEQRGAQREADLLADPGASTIGRRCEGEGGQGRGREPVGVEPAEEVRGDDLTQRVDLLGDKVSAEWLSVDQLEGPGSDPHRNVGAAQPSALLNEAVKPDVGERTPHVGEHLHDPQSHETGHRHDPTLASPGDDR
jgi:hypothetical protein